VKVLIIPLQFCLLFECQRHHLEDVPGVMNADPRYFENASLLNQILIVSIELAFYGATVIHPKHIQPLQKISFM
jgi:aspartokinase